MSSTISGLKTKSKISILRRMILLGHTYRADIKFVTDIPTLSKKRRYSKSAIFLVRRCMSNGSFKL